jgi:hypothetical protein
MWLGALQLSAGVSARLSCNNQLTHARGQARLVPWAGRVA